MKNENLIQLVENITNQPIELLNNKEQFKYCSISCELLTCDISSMNSALVRDNTILDRLYSFLHKNSPFNPLIASFYTKVVCSIISRNTEYVIC